MNNKNIVILFILFFTLINLNLVNAFDLTSTELEKSACPSSTILLNANVFGTGSFNVNLEGSASKWATVVPQGFTLANEAKVIYIYVTPKFDTNPGGYDLNLIVTSNNEVKQINYKINVPDCHNLIISGDDSKSICGCNSDVYNFTISNNGIYQETYKVEFSGKAAPWIRLSQDSLSLLPGQSKTIYAFLNAPCGGDFGENDFTIVVRSLTSNAVASFDSNVIVTSCFDFDAKVDKQFIGMCEHSSEVIPININNLAELNNEFDLAIKGPAWANLNVNKLELASEASGIINIILSPDYKVEGDFDIDVNIKGKQSKISKDIKVKSSIRKCNDVSFELLTREDRLCVGSKKIYGANIKNLGEFEKEFRIESSHGWAVPQEVILTLDPGQSKKIKIEFNPSENLTAQKYEIKFRALALDSSKISNEDSFDLDLVSREQCYKPEVNVQDVLVDADSSATTKIVIKNIGAELAVYEIGITGNANSFSQLNPSTISIEPGKSEIIYLYIAPPYNTKAGDYKANVFISLKNAGILESKTINIKVNAPKPAIFKEENKTSLLKDLWEKINLFVKNLNVPKNQTVLEPLTDLNRESFISKNVKFIFENETHSLKILEVKNSSVTLSIESRPIFVLLDLNETEEIDLNNDNKTDLRLELRSIDKEGTPTIKVSKILEEAKEPGLDLKGVKDRLYKYKYAILVSLIIIIGLILFFSTNAYKKLINYFEEEDEGEEEPLKIGRYVLLVLILIVLFWYFRTYSDKFSLLLNYLNIYKYYIIAGLIILIFLILIITYWKQIVDFFEEDVDERPKRKK
jgi:uncharacterized membrane protein